MSDTNGASRRRRIAGERGPAAPAAKKSPLRKLPAKKPASTKPATAKPVSVKPVGATAAAPAARVPTRKPVPTTSPSAVEKRRPRSRPSRRDLRWLVPATLVAVAALVVGVFLVIDPPGDGAGADGSSLDASSRQASSSAASAAETIFSFRYDQLDDHLTTSKALMTPTFSAEFDKIAPALTELAPQRKIVVQAVARESAAMPCGRSCSATKADVLVFVDQARLVGDSKEPTVFANRIKVSMVKDGDTWLVNDIRAL